MKEIGCPTCGELFPVEVIVESMGIRETVRCQDAYHAAPAPGVPPVENAQEASAASTPLETTADAYGSDGELWSRYNELVECPKCGFRFHEDHEDEGAATRQYSCPVCENVDLREQLRASEALAKSPLSPPPTSEPSEEGAPWRILDLRDGWEEVVSALRAEASHLDSTQRYSATNAGDIRAAADFIETLAARRASRVEMTELPSVDAVWNLVRVWSDARGDTTKDWDAKRFAAYDAIKALHATASHREPGGPDVNATRLRTLYDALPFQQQMRFGGDFAEFCEGLDVRAQRSGRAPSVEEQPDISSGNESRKSL